MGCSRLLAPLAMLWLGACAGPLTHELPAAYRLEPDGGHGIVIGSVSALPAPGNPPWYEWSRYEFRSRPDATVAGHVTSAFKWNPFYMWGSMPLCADDGLEAECAHLFALLLPAGEYELHAVIPAMQSHASSADVSPGRWDTRLQHYRFVVAAGQATYIGNLVSRICIGSRGRGNDVMAAIGAARDRAARDLPLLLRKYPQLEGMSIRSQPLPADIWRWRFREAQGYEPPHGWPPECTLDAAAAEQYLTGAAP